MARPKADYAPTVNKLLRELGIGKPVAASANEIATLIDEPYGRVSRVLNVMSRAGALKQEFAMSPKGRQVTYTLLVDTLAEIERRMTEKGLFWSAYEEENASFTTNPKPHNGTVKSLAELAPMRKSEPRAELEVARKHRNQQAFIVAERARFEEMGLTLPEPTPVFDEDRRHELDAIVRVLPYIESIEKANAYLEEQNKTMRAPIGEVGALRGRVASQTEQIEKLVREKGEIKDDVQRLMDDHRREVAALKEQISDLQGQLRTVRGERQINGAIGSVAQRG